MWEPPPPPADHPGTVSLTPKEAVGIVARSLQSAAWPIGAVSAAASAIVFRQTLLGDGVQRFWELLDDGEDLGAGSYGIVAEGKGWATVAGSRVSALLVGPGCFDLVCAYAKSWGVGSVYLSGAIHDGFLPGLVVGVARRGAVCLATVRNSKDGAADRWYLAAPSSAGWVLSFGSTQGLDATAVVPAEADAASLHQELAQRWHGGLVTAAGVEVGWDGFGQLAFGIHPPELSSAPDASIVVIGVRSGSGWTDSHAHRLTSEVGDDRITFDSSRYQKRYKAERAEGVDVGWDQWWQLQDYADRTLVPTSEESRLGAGSLGDPDIEALE